MYGMVQGSARFLASMGLALTFAGCLAGGAGGTVHHEVSSAVSGEDLDVYLGISPRNPKAEPTRVIVHYQSGGDNGWREFEMAPVQAIDPDFFRYKGVIPGDALIDGSTLKYKFTFKKYGEWYERGGGEVVVQ